MGDGDRSALATNSARSLEARSSLPRLHAQGQVADSAMSNIQGILFGVSEWSDGRSVYLKTP